MAGNYVGTKSFQMKKKVAREHFQTTDGRLRKQKRHLLSGGTSTRNRERVLPLPKNKEDPELQGAVSREKNKVVPIR